MRTSEINPKIHRLSIKESSLYHGWGSGLPVGAIPEWGDLCGSPLEPIKSGTLIIQPPHEGDYTDPRISLRTCSYTYQTLVRVCPTCIVLCLVRL